MDEFHEMLIRKIEIRHLKGKVLEMILFFKYDGVYSVEDVMEDLKQLAKEIEQMESAMEEVLK